MSQISTKVLQHLLIFFFFDIGINEPSLQIVKFEDGFYYGITVINKSYLIAAYGRINPGLLRYKLQHLNQYFTKIFEQMK